MSGPTFRGMSRALGLLALLTAALAVASGCGGAGTSLSAEPITAEQLTRAASASVEAKSSRFDLAFGFTFPGAPGTFELAGEGAFDSAKERATMTLDLSSLGGLLGGLMGGLGGQDAPDFGNPEAWKLDAIVDGKVAYLRFPAMAGKLPEGKTWVKIDATKAGKGASGLGLEGLESFTNSDPRSLLDVLKAVSGEIETVGTEELRGTPTTHYRATLDLRNLDQLVPEAETQGADLGAMLDQVLGQAGLSEMPFDVWLDEAGLVRKVEASFSMAPPGEQGKLEASMSFELYDYGVEVDVTPPPAGEVVDASTLR